MRSRTRIRTLCGSTRATSAYAMRESSSSAWRARASSTPSKSSPCRMPERSTIEAASR
jgi:hypothetical protein